MRMKLWIDIILFNTIWLPKRGVQKKNLYVGQTKIKQTNVMWYVPVKQKKLLNNQLQKKDVLNLKTHSMTKNEPSNGVCGL